MNLLYYFEKKTSKVNLVFDFGHFKMSIFDFPKILLEKIKKNSLRAYSFKNFLILKKPVTIKIKYLNEK